MMHTKLKGKKVIVGVTASIAAYKSALLVREFIKSGAEVKVIMTDASQKFITPLTLSTLSKNPVYSTFTSEGNGAVWNSHVDLGLWADFIVIAPATANTISKMANGLVDNLLIATYLSAKCMVYIAPAMDLDMYRHPSTKCNIEKLRSFNNTIIESNFGELASGLIGEGRMAEPSEIVEFISNDIEDSLALANKKVLITAGPTYEAIDPVRFLGNHSSGEMGFEIAKVCADKGADVILISGPSTKTIKHARVKRIDVVSAKEMYDVVMEHFSTTDIGVFVAAVSDYKPKNVFSKKIKGEDVFEELKLEKNIDILEAVGKIKKKQFLVGFALETNNEVENATKKMKKKNLDFIVLNSLKDRGAGFKSHTNKISIIEKTGEITSFGLKQKREVALDIVNKIISKQ